MDPRLAQLPRASALRACFRFAFAPIRVKFSPDLATLRTLDETGVALGRQLQAERRRSQRRSAGGGADYLDVLSPSIEARAALLDAARRELQPDVIHLDDLEDRSPTLGIARSLAASSEPLEIRSRFPCPYLPIRGAWDAYLRAAPRRDNLRRRERWFAA